MARQTHAETSIPLDVASDTEGSHQDINMWVGALVGPLARLVGPLVLIALEHGSRGRDTFVARGGEGVYIT